MSGHVPTRPAASRPALIALAIVSATLVVVATCGSTGSSLASALDARGPTVANLDPDLLDALREAAADAAEDGVEIVVTSGWRSATHQKRLFLEAVKKLGSERRAARWVAAPDRSAHVAGQAVDVGHSATAWLSRHGAGYGLCQIYRNEPWHYELRRDAIDDGCPPRYADPTHDPRMQG